MHHTAAKAVVDTGFVALGYVKVAFLGVIQGITELLPVSSSAHMRIVPALLGWSDPGAAFSAAMQMAALVGVVSYFWHDIVGLCTGSVSALVKRDFKDQNLTFSFFILIGTLPIALCGVLLSPIINAPNSPLRSIGVIGAACLAMALLLALTELLAKHKRDMTQWKFMDVILVGIAQAFALIPGVSRSGSTLTAALGLGFKREDAARFSFILGLPAIALAGGKEFYELYKAHLDAHGWSILGVGLLTGAISSFFAIWGLMKFLEKFSAWPFVIYRGVLGVFLIFAASSGLLH